ncbi:MAG: hypothetical protein H0X24_14480 [Ktedonobacterales bacterium]|nr:hypothetical protein [Ktedonobacterales bacterium]
MYEDVKKGQTIGATVDVSKRDAGNRGPARERASRDMPAAKAACVG